MLPRNLLFHNIKRILQFETANSIRMPWVDIIKVNSKRKRRNLFIIQKFDLSQPREFINEWWINLRNSKARCLSNSSKATSVTISAKGIFFKNPTNHLKCVWMLILLCCVQRRQDMQFFFVNNMIKRLCCPNYTHTEYYCQKRKTDSARSSGRIRNQKTTYWYSQFEERPKIDFYHELKSKQTFISAACLLPHITKSNT